MTNKQNNLCGRLAENMTEIPAVRMSGEKILSRNKARPRRLRTRPQRRSQRQQSIFRSVAGDNDENTTQ